MPRLTEARRTANRAAIVDAARRCFARSGYHQTSMPEIAAEAGVSTGAPYRYFSGKQELVVEVARLAFASIFDPVMQFIADSDGITIGDLIARAAAALPSSSNDRRPEQDELLRCGVDAWGELLRNEGLRTEAIAGLDRTMRRIAEALRDGQAYGSVPADLNPEMTARIVVSLLHGLMLQRTAFGLTEVDGFVRDVRITMDRTPTRATPGRC